MLKLENQKNEMEGDIAIVSDYVDWGLIDFYIPDFWQILKTRGSNIKIAIIDSGISLHKDLIKNIKTDLAFDAIENKDWTDGNGHGTSVAGVIAAEDSGYGIVGVAPHSSIIPIKVLNEKNILPSMECLEIALEYILKIKPDIVNISIGGKYPLSSKCEAILEELNKLNIPAVCAVGNHGKNYDCYPAKYETTISVGSFDKNKNISQFSSTSESVDFVFPGEKILTTTLNNKYICASGTSYAAPFLSGLLALIISNYKYLNKTFSVNNLKQMIIDSCEDYGEAGKDYSYGYGIVSMEKLIAKIKCN